MQCARHGQSEPCNACALEDTAKGEDLGTLPSPLDAGHSGPLPGTQIGRYAVKELLGGGGMGLVYLAIDPHLGREVAIKLLRAALETGHASATGQARLLREAQLMAQLSHPNVTPVYDVGSFEGSVFMAMERVRGMPLDRWLLARPRGWREVLELMLKAGAGLEAAHAAGLVHRDFKPANVLVGEDGRPRVSDFGIAQSTRTPDVTPQGEPRPSFERPLTLAGALMGSPGYMAPEQYFGLQTSAASDQFSFCVTLYEGLYGVRPFQGRTVAELGSAAISGQVPLPPKGSAVPSWLFPIVCKGLSPRARERYPSMSALLHALSRDPAQARRRFLVSAGAVALAALVAVAAASTLREPKCRGIERLLDSVWDDGTKDAGRRAFEATQRSYAASAWVQAQREADAYAAQWVRARTEACEATRVRREQTDEVMQARIDCLEQRRRELEALARAYARADVMTVDHAYLAAGRLSALDTCARARAGQGPNTPESRQAIEALNLSLAAGRSLGSAGQLEAARAQISGALEAASRLGLAGPRAQAELALGQLESDAHRYGESAAAFERAAAAAEVAGDDETAAQALTLQVSMTGWRLERPQVGRTYAALARAKLQRIGGNARIEAQLSESLGDCEWQGGDKVLALANYRRALEQFVALVGDESLDAARLHSAIGWVLSEQGEAHEARAELEQSRQTRERLLGAEHPVLAQSWKELGSLAGVVGDAEESLRCSREELRISRAAFEPGSVAVARAAANLASRLVASGLIDEAEPLIDEASRVMEAHSDAPVGHRLRALAIRARIFKHRGNLTEAEATLRQALALAERTLGADHWETAVVAYELGLLLNVARQWAPALELFERVLSAHERLRSGPFDIAQALLGGAVALEGLGRRAEARQRLERAVSQVPLEAGDHVLAGRVRLALARSLGRRSARGEALAREAMGCFERVKRADLMAEAEAWLQARGNGKL